MLSNLHNENSVYHPKTAGLTGRKKNKVLFSTPALKGPLKSGFKTDKVPRSASKSTALAEITNQTPFTKAHVPITPSIKPLKSFAIFTDDDVAPSTRRISSTRRKLRLPRSASNKFETPETKGNYWDVSDTSIEGSVIEDASIMEEDYGDVEYAPPTAIEPKFDPGFDMPDYKEVGATLMSLFRQTTIPNDYDPGSDFDGANLLEEIGPLVWEKLELPDISSNDIFPMMTPPESSRPSKPLTGKTTHTRIPSISRPKVAQAATQTTRLDSKGKSSSHPRTTSAPLRIKNAPFTRTGSVPSKNMGTTGSKPTSMTSRNGLAKPVRKFVPSNERKPGVKSQQNVIPDDTVLSLLADFENEPLGEEFLFTV